MENRLDSIKEKVGQKKPFYKKRWFAVVVTIFIVLLVAIGSSEEKNKANESKKQTEQESVKKPDTDSNPQENNTEITKKDVKQEESVEPFEISVISQIVKKVDGKHRYFFDIRNNDKNDFDGKVSIMLYNDKQNSALGGDIFETVTPIKSQMGNSVNLNINTGPTSVHGEYGITKFKYEVKIDNKVVKSGEGKITDKYEDLSQYGL